MNQKMNIIKITLALIFTLTSFLTLATVNYQEKNGVVVIEAEHFASQHLTDKRRWIVFSNESQQHNYPDNDLFHANDASSGAYIEILPDTRTNHTETLVRGENFSAIPGKMAVLTYPVYFSQAGTYYVWARAFSTGSEDNGVHIGLNGRWPETSQRLQLCDNKHQWTWSSAQRTPENHCGEPKTIKLNISEPGVHTIMLSMREDGFELDKLLLTTNSNYTPTGQDKSATLSKYIELEQKKWLKEIHQYKKILYAATDFSHDDKGQINYFKNTEQNLVGISGANQKQLNQYAYAQYQVDKKDQGRHQLTLVTLPDGNASKYKILLNKQVIAEFNKATASKADSEVYFKVNNVDLKKGDLITVASMITHVESESYPIKSARWRALVIGTQD